MIELAAFLGNPGREYAGNRHNAGRLLAGKCPFFASLRWREKFKGRYASLESGRLLPYQNLSAGLPGSALCESAFSGPSPAAGGRDDPPERIHFLMPETYMNLSGDSVYAAASFFKIPPERVLVVHDELELPLGTAALKFSGGLGGHNGLRSMKARFGTADFWRLRIGIGRPNHADISLWVLSDFTPPERPALERVLDACAAALTEALLRGPESLLPEWNKKKIPGPQEAVLTKRADMDNYKEQ
jgi:PTH1 family peptidyl-tRNA hydrolase